MPVIRLYSPAPSPGSGVLEELAEAVTGLLGIPSGHCWLWWERLEPGTYHRPEWRELDGAPAPIGEIVCKESYSQGQVGKLLLLLQERLGSLLDVPADEIYLTVRRALPGELLVRGQLWPGDEGRTVGMDGRVDPGDAVVAEGAVPAKAGAAANGVAASEAKATVPDLVPIAFVHNARRELIDDDWGEVASVIRLDADQFGPDALLSLDSFSHLEVVFHFHRVPPEKVERGARHPRHNPDWPLAGIFAQRGKNRPNRIGVSRCRLLRVDGLELHVLGLDAVDGTPVLDVKPYLRQFAPRGEVSQPDWVDDLMRDYY